VIARRLAPPAVTAAARGVRRMALAPTLRTCALIGIGLLWLVPAWTDRRAAALMIAWDAIVLGAMVIDAVRLPRATSLRVTRRWSGALMLGAPIGVVLDLQNDGSVPIAATLRDYLPPALRPDLAPVEVRVGPRASSSVSSTVTPRERGDRTTGEVVVEWRSAWALVERWAQAPLEQTVRVYANLHEGRRHSMYLIRSRQIALEKRRARQIGSGREFESLREYRPGDERRDVSWSVSARRARLVSKVYQPERSQTVWLLLDAGRLLRARTENQTLLDRAATAAMALAQVAMTSGDNVGLIAYGRRIQQRLQPGRGATQMRSLTEALALVRAEGVEADHGAAAAALRNGQKRRALVVWLTEVAETAGVPDVIEYATGLVPRHVLLFATMRQPELSAMAAVSPSTPADMYRVLSAHEAADRREALLRGLRQRGALVIETSPEALSGGLVDRYLAIKERGMV
jgi:uncharacterized protein (DUF58 family)